MRQLLPIPLDDVEPYAAYRPADPRGDLVRIDMVASVDGAVVDEKGGSGSLGGDGDREVFRTLRALADAIVVGAGTARSEGYGPHRLSDRLRAARDADGRQAPAPVVVVSRSLNLDYGSSLFADAVTPTIVATTSAADPGALRRAESAGEVLIAGDGEAVDPLVLVEGLGRRGLRHLLVEGGPTLNGALLDAGLVDELCITFAPGLLGGAGPALSGGMRRRRSLELRSLLEQEGELYARYGVVAPPR